MRSVMETEPYASLIAELKVRVAYGREEIQSLTDNLHRFESFLLHLRHSDEEERERVLKIFAEQLQEMKEADHGKWICPKCAELN